MGDEHWEASLYYQIDTYLEWVQREGVPVVETLAFRTVVPPAFVVKLASGEALPTAPLNVVVAGVFTARLNGPPTPLLTVLPNVTFALADSVLLAPIVTGSL